MADSGKYGNIPIGKIPESEPVFVLRAQDQLADATLRIYQILAASQDSKIAPKISEVIEKFKSWKGIRKNPD